jgi:hypothetical protein
MVPAQGTKWEIGCAASLVEWNTRYDPWPRNERTRFFLKKSLTIDFEREGERTQKTQRGDSAI